MCEAAMRAVEGISETWFDPKEVLRTLLRTLQQEELTGSVSFWFSCKTAKNGGGSLNKNDTAIGLLILRLALLRFPRQ